MSESRGPNWDKAALEASPAVMGVPFNNLDEAPTHVKPIKEARPEADSTPAMDRDLIGAMLDHFELLECIGVGGMGRVFLGRDTRLDRLVALKVLAPEMARDVEICRRFHQEAKAAARLDAPYFARAYFYGQDKGLLYIAMEYVEGDNLRKMITQYGRLDYGLVLNIGLQIARGLAHAAALGVVHRDIKPSNIIITPHGTAKLVDMGLARDFLQSATEITQAGVTLGTFDYISPEQAHDPRTVDIRSDIYSLGCTLYHALTGAPPYPGGSPFQKVLQHKIEVIPDPRRVVADLPDAVAALVLKMMAKRPADRYATPAQLIHDMRLVSQSLAVPLVDQAAPGESLTFLGPGFWERQLDWLGPTALLLGTLLAYSYFNRPIAHPEALPEWPSRRAELAQAETVDPTTAKTKPVATVAKSNNTPAVLAKPAPRPEPPEKPKFPVQPRPGSRTETVPEKTSPLVSPVPMVPTAFAVDPNGAAGSAAGLFRFLGNACEEAESGATIVLRTNETITERDILIPDKEITIQAAEGFRPRLRLQPIEGDSEPHALFRLTGKAKLRLIDIPVEVASGTQPDEYAHLSIFDCSDSARVELLHLAIEAGRDRQLESLAIVKVQSPTRNQDSTAMPVDGSTHDPVFVSIKQCRIRARGSLLVSSPPDYWAVEIEDSFLALDDPLARVRGGSRARVRSGVNQLHVQQSTLLLRGGLISLLVEGDQPEPPREVRFEAKRSFFVAVGPGALTESSGRVATHGDLIRWSGRNNVVVGFTTPFRHPMGETLMANTPMNRGWEEWLRTETLETDSFYHRPETSPPVSSIWETPIPAATEERFGLSPEIARHLGVPLEKLPP